MNINVSSQGEIKVTQRLFVYGTLGPGRPNEHVLSVIGGTWEEASVNGYLKQQGWGAEMGYPGIVLDDDGDEIKGYIFFQTISIIIGMNLIILKVKNTKEF